MLPVPSPQPPPPPYTYLNTQRDFWQLYNNLSPLLLCARIIIVHVAVARIPFFIANVFFFKLN